MNQRRDFLKGLGAAALVGPNILASTANARPNSKFQDPIPEPGTWEDRRRLFNYDSSKIMATNFLLASHPLPVRDAIMSEAAALDANPPLMMSLAGKKNRAVQERIARFFDCDADGVALTHSTIEGMHWFWYDFALNPSDEVLLTTHDHPDMDAAINYRHARTPLKVSRVTLYEPTNIPSAEEMVAKMQAAITPNTRVIVSTWVHSSTGVKLPIGMIGAMIKSVNATRPDDQKITFFVDGVHGFGLETDSFKDLNCDFFTSGTHKWLCGPRGTGMLVGTADAWKNMTRVSLPNYSNSTPGSRYTWNGYFAYEHRWAVPAAMDLQIALGRTKIRDHVHGLCTILKTELSKMKNVVLYTPMSPTLSAGIVCFDVQGIKQTDVVAALAQKDIVASSTPYRNSYARIGLSLTNSESEVEVIVRAIADLSGN